MGENYPSNRIGDQKRRDRVAQVAKGVPRDASLGRRVREAIISTESGSIGGYILFDVLIPALKSTLTDVIGEATSRFFYGEPGSRKPASGRGSYTSYGRVISSGRPHDGSLRDRKYEVSRKARSNHDFESVEFETRVEASNVLDSLVSLISTYGSATVQDLYDLCGITAEPVDTTWGWHNLSTASVVRIRDGYILDMPRPVPLDN